MVGHKHAVDLIAKVLYSHLIPEKNVMILQNLILPPFIYFFLRVRILILFPYDKLLPHQELDGFHCGFKHGGFLHIVFIQVSSF